MHQLMRFIAMIAVGFAIAWTGVAAAQGKGSKGDKPERAAEKPEKTLFERTTEAIDRAEKAEKVGGAADECRGRACNPNFNETQKLDDAAGGSAR